MRVFDSPFTDKMSFISHFARVEWIIFVQMMQKSSRLCDDGSDEAAGKDAGE